MAPPAPRPLDEPPRRPPRLAAIVLSFGHVELAARAVASLRASERAVDEIVVVDNDPAGSFRAVLDRFDRPPSYLPNESNLGFSAGMNRGLRHALARGADLLLLVNSDAVLPERSLGILEAALAAHPEAGLAAPVLVARADPTFVASAGFTFSPRSGRARQLGFGRRLDEVAPPAWRELPAASGCVQLLHRDLVERIGLLDDDFFFSFEDLEYCLRARRAGCTVGVAGEALALHEGGASLPESSPARLYFATRNHLLAASRGAPLARRAARAARAAAIVALNLAHALRTPAGPVATRLRAVAAGLADARAGRYGGRAWAPRTPDDLARF
jgi:hypothetical protein